MKAIEIDPNSKTIQMLVRVWPKLSLPDKLRTAESANAIVVSWNIP
jgi:hypothetical protein